jgi:hypothetical protein
MADHCGNCRRSIAQKLFSNAAKWVEHLPLRSWFSAAARISGDVYHRALIAGSDGA